MPQLTVWGSIYSDNAKVMVICDQLHIFQEHSQQLNRTTHKLKRKLWLQLEYAKDSGIT